MSLISLLFSLISLFNFIAGLIVFLNRYFNFLNLRFLKYYRVGLAFINLLINLVSKSKIRSITLLI